MAFPGITTRLSEDTIASTTVINPRADLIKVTGTTAIATINGQFGGGQAGLLFIYPTDGTVNLVTTGNVAVAVTCPQNKVTTLVWSQNQQKWYPAISA